MTLPNKKAPFRVLFYLGVSYTIQAPASGAISL